MKKLLTLTLVFLFGIGFSSAENSEDNRRYRNYSKNFIFNQDGIEFAVFPDGQFDFNYLQDRNGVDIYVNTGNTQVSFNTGYNYDRFVQYDTYGAVIQIEQIPVFYDSFGRVNQIGNVNIFYNNGFINRIGNLNVFYSRPGIINYHRGYINSFNRFYVYQPWHNFYNVPVFNRCIVYNNPYRVNYFPLRYAWSYHRNYWNTPTYYNGCYSRENLRRNFYRPNDRVNYRSFERGRRDSRGRAVAANNRVNRNREAISTGRSQVTRSTRTGRSVATANSGRTATNTGRSTGVATRSTSTGRSTELATNRSTRAANTRATSTRGTSRSNTVTSAGNRSTRSTTAAPNRSTRTSNEGVSTRSTRTQTATPTRSTRTNRATPTRSTRTNRATSTRSTRNNTRATAPRATSSRNTQARNTRATSSRSNAQARSTRATSTQKKSRSTRSNRRG